ncbi:MAG: SDR family NAD(P)-dependent oxidoreductase [Alphaproteobacteria bacterium]|nr:SDR family NAD(P)-dependent oxidoreductase [Alphaproteobacteria bacterium]
MTEVAMVVGVGRGLGAGLCRRFAQAGMDVILAARRAEALAGIAAEVAAEGVRARAVAADASLPGDVERLFEVADAEFGPPDLVVYNVGGAPRKPVLEMTPEEIEASWRAACLGGFRVAQAAARRMVARGRGTILFTGATGALRGSVNCVALAVGKFGLRAVAESMARELGPRGVHVAHVVIDGQILGPRWQHLANERGPDALLTPESMAETYLMLHRQPRDAWTFQLELRPWVEKF